MAALIGYAAVWLAVVAVLIAVYYVIRRESVFEAHVFAAGTLVRLVSGGAAFAISYYELPILKEFYTGDGFWTLAVDAEAYFHMAAEATRAGLGTIRDSDPSPMYLRAMAVWMEGTGVTPASAVLFNVLCYAGTAFLLAKVFRAGAASTVALVIITVSPALLFVSTQALKDSVCVFLIVAIAAGVGIWSESLTRAEGSRYAARWSSAVIVCVGFYAFAGIRTYFAVFMLASLVAASIWSVLVGQGAVSRLRILALNSALVAMALLSSVLGGGPYVSYYYGLPRAMLGAPAESIAAFDAVRAGFVGSGGATNFAKPPAEPPAESPGESPAEATTERAASSSESVRARLQHVATGFAAMFVPISVLKALSIMNFSGGRGLLLITDLDTVVIDLGLGVGLCLLVLQKRTARLSPATMFVAVLAILTTVAMAYTVTNFGTLFRLRLLASTPLLLVPVFALYSEPRPRSWPMRARATDP